MYDARFDARHLIRRLHTVMKPAKPSTAFPLFAHDNGQWAKKIRGKTRYFGSWDDPDAAFVKYKRWKRPPRMLVRSQIQRVANQL